MNICQARNSEEFIKLEAIALARVKAKYPHVMTTEVHWHPLGWEYGTKTIEAFEALFMDPRGPNHVVVRMFLDSKRILIMLVDDSYSSTMGWHNDHH